MTDSRAAWVCALWCGAAHRLIRERIADPDKAPYSARARAADASCIRGALAGHPYLAEPAAEALALLEPDAR